MWFERNIVFWMAALAVFVALLWLLSPILLPFVLGMAIAYVLDPLANQLSKRGVGRLLARPTATLSLEAQQRRELKQKMFGD